MADAQPALSALVEELELPLSDAAVDRVLLVHALEMSQDAVALLREVWRVLAPGGQLLAVVPNRRGVWARMDTTPFGHGRPYSRSQITHLLRETWFTPVAWSEALYVPPIAARLVPALGGRLGAHRRDVSAPFAGVHIVEATKQVYRAIPARREKRSSCPRSSRCWRRRRAARRGSPMTKGPGDGLGRCRVAIERLLSCCPARRAVVAAKSCCPFCRSGRGPPGPRCRRRRCGKRSPPWLS